MQGLFFEKINEALRDYPYMDFERENLSYVSHFHEEIEIIKVLSGEITVICENRKFTAKKGDICFFLPGDIHSFQSTESKSVVMKINCKNSREQIDFHSLKVNDNHIAYGGSLNVILGDCINRLEIEDKNKKSGYGYAVNSISNNIICEILRSGRVVKGNTEYKKRHIFYISVLEKVNRYTELHYKEEIVLKDVASHCNLSQYYFAHIFKEITGSTYVEFLTAYRIEKAFEELKSKNKKITYIALNCGFSSLRSFNRVFKKHTGVTPTEYRNNINNDN